MNLEPPARARIAPIAPGRDGAAKDLRETRDIDAIGPREPAARAA